MDRELRITTRYNNLYKYDVEVDCSDAGQNGVCVLQGGYAIALLKELSTFLNFRVKQVPHVDAYAFGNATSKGVDLFVGSYVLRSARARIVDPTFVTGFSKLVTFLNHEHESAYQDVLFRPFQSTLWIAAFGVLILSLITIGLIQTACMRLHRCHLQIVSNINITTKDVIFEGIATFLQKGTFTLRCLNVSVRIALCITSFCFFLSVVLYSGAVVAILSVPKSGITSIEALISSNYQILLDKGYGNGSSSQILLEALRVSDKTVDNFLKKASKTKILFDNFEKSILEVHNNPVALMTEDDSGLGAISSVLGQLPCSWTQIPVKGIRYPTCMFMKKHMPYRQEINSLLLKMSERGVMGYLKRKWIHQDGRCFQEPGVVRAAALQNVSAGFLIVAGGFIISILIVAIEFSVWRSRV